MSPDQARFCLLIGAMKCGTTTLFDLLARHPEIVGSREKEPGFFTFPEVYARGLDWYMGLWDGPKRAAATNPILLEASTHYTKAPDLPCGAPKIAKHLRDVKFIYLCRDPIARIESQADYDLMRGRLRSRARYTDDHFLNVTRYMAQLHPYLDTFGEDRVLVLDFDRLVGETESLLREIAAFLGVDAEPFAGIAAPHENRTPPSITKRRQILNWAAYTHKPKIVQRFLYGATAPLHFIRHHRAPMTEAEQREVLDALAPDIQAFRTHFGWYPSGLGGIL